MSIAGPASSAPAGDVEPVANETRDRIITGVVTGLPFVSLIFVAWQAWEGWLHPRDVVIFVLMYLLTGLGVTVGFHRLFTHRSFKTGKVVRATLGILGSAAIEGPMISWVADHRKHHAFSDQPGDPHSPHVDHGHGWRGALQGLLHAHMGWLFIHTERGLKTRYAPDLLKDPVVAFVDRTFLWWALAGLAVPFGLGYLLGGTLDAALTGLLWGGLVRMLVVHHVTYSINSLCHFFGRRDYRDGRRIAQSRVAGAVLVRRVLAQQPPRVPDGGRARHALVAGRRLGVRDPRPGALRAGVGRGASGARAPGGQGRGLRPADAGRSRRPTH